MRTLLKGIALLLGLIVLGACAEAVSTPEGPTESTLRTVAAATPQDLEGDWKVEEFGLSYAEGLFYDNVTAQSQVSISVYDGRWYLSFRPAFRGWDGISGTYYMSTDQESLIVRTSPYGSGGRVTLIVTELQMTLYSRTTLEITAEGWVQREWWDGGPVPFVAIIKAIKE